MAAQAQWDRDCDTLRKRLGLADLDHQLDAAHAELVELIEAIRSTDPQSAAGVRMKATLAIEAADWLPKDHAAELAWSLVRTVAA